ncbi:ATP-binding protein [Streptomyces sp. NPDC096012]|uniref:ATP-binding protein n=1 Tax=Streptomyces sp. NPDC096012 TaxID=3155684 RepID=UPI00336A92DA
MDPNTPGPEEHGPAYSRRSPRESLTSDFVPGAPALARTAQVVCGDLLLTVNPVDGSEIELCPPWGTARPGEAGSGGGHPGRPRRRTLAERAEAERAARPPVPPGPALPAHALLERQDERERLVRLLARGRSVRLTGPGGSGRTALLDLVAEDCRDLAPDGVVRLSGFHRTSAEVLDDLFHAVYDAPGHRPGRDELLDSLRDIGAVVLLDDAEFGGPALDELLDATPECAFLLAVTPDVPAPSAESEIEEVFLGGLDRAAGVEILERTIGRVLTEDEANWAGDLWFESEGLPLRFVQAGALLRQREELRASTGAVDEYGVFEDARPPVDLPVEPDEGAPLPSLGEAAAAAPLLASRLSASARATLRFAVALGDEVPHQAHLPALVGDTHADAALGELVECGLVSPVGSRYRLAAGVLTQLEAAGFADDAPAHALIAARHYTWWAGHPSVTPERVCAEADAVLAALTAAVPQTSPPAEGEEAIAVRLARTAAPAFAAGLHWGAWERALRAGAEAARPAGEVSEQAYFHHELGVLALCGGQLDRARAELEASIGLRGALADKRGTVAGRRALALVADRSGEATGAVSAGGEVTPAGFAGDEVTRAGSVAGELTRAGSAAGEEVPEARLGESGPRPYGFAGAPLATRRLPAAEPHGGGLRRLARRNLVAVGSGALLVAVLGTVVTLGMTSPDAGKDPAGRADVHPPASQDLDDGGLGTDPKDTGAGGGAGSATGKGRATAASRPTAPGPDGTYGTADDPAPQVPAGPSSGSGWTKGPHTGSASPKPSRPSTTKPGSPSPTKETPSHSPSSPSSSSGTPSQTATPSGSSTPSTTDTASGPLPSGTQTDTRTPGAGGAEPA